MFKNPSLVKLKCEAQQQVPLPAESYRAHTLSLNAVASEGLVLPQVNVPAFADFPKEALSVGRSG